MLYTGVSVEPRGPFVQGLSPSLLRTLQLPGQGGWEVLHAAPLSLRVLGHLERPCRIPAWAREASSRASPCQRFPLTAPIPQARDVYEEAIRTVMTVRDFTQVFDSYAQFEESMIAAKMETASELGREEEDDVDLELRLARFEQLISRRPLLLNSVLLRQNPHHVHEWHKRVALHQGRPREIINTYTEAVQTVDPFKATGKPHTLWVAFAKFYEDNGQLDDARIILEKATKVNFKQVDDLASVWCQCGELELRHENYDEALRLLRKATALPARRAEYFDGSEPVQNRVYKSLKVWSMLADLEESLGTFQVSCRGESVH
ncbi:Hypothetical predicted protein [Marmota monax]|uniref:Pre-mRNA-splicing factor SYF1 n=1 Tax=Marmota monax TaxID=9995 RepID=A0A5E4CI92_MARMO|nr:Hypothetical predicted protein [Marmota monax]